MLNLAFAAAYLFVAMCRINVLSVVPLLWFHMANKTEISPSGSRFYSFQCCHTAVFYLSDRWAVWVELCSSWQLVNRFLFLHTHAHACTHTYACTICTHTHTHIHIFLYSRMILLKFLCCRITFLHSHDLNVEFFCFVFCLVACLFIHCVCFCCLLVSVTRELHHYQPFDQPNIVNCVFQ